MRAPGIIGTIQLAAVVALALPAALFGLSLVVDGRPIGGVFVALGVLMLALQYALTNPFDPADIAESAAERLTRDEK